MGPGLLLATASLLAQNAALAACATSDGYTLGTVDLLDGRVFRAEIQVDPRP